jgi:hypothetical protein
MATKNAFALKAFTDAGTERTFEGGKVHSIDDGDYANYEAAGLVRAATAADAKAEVADSKSKAEA